MTGHPGPPLSPPPAERCYPALTGLNAVTDPTKLPPDPQTPAAALEQNQEVELQELTTLGFSKSSENGFSKERSVSKFKLVRYSLTLSGALGFANSVYAPQPIPWWLWALVS